MSEDAVRSYARERHFSSAMVERWLGRPARDRDGLLDLAARFRLGENQLRGLFDLLEDIAARRRSSVSEVLRAPSVVSVLGRELGRNETVKLLKAELHRLRYPRLVEIEQRLAALAKSMKLPVGAHIAFPENLEGEDVCVTVRAANARELRARAAAVAAALEGGEVDEIFQLLGGEW